MGSNDTPRHVLMTADTVGGVWTYAIELAEALASHGIRVSLATMGKPAAGWQVAEARAIPSFELFEGTYPLEWQDNPWDGVDEAGAWLLNLERRLKPDIVHINGYAHTAMAWNAPTVCVAHSCVCSWWRAVKQEPAPDRYAEYRTRVRAGLDSASVVVAPSNAMLQSLEREYGYSGGGLCVANARSATTFGPAEKQPHILAIGRLWDEGKNIRALDAVAGSVSWPVYVAGDDADPDGRSHTFTGVRPLGRLSTPELAERFARAAVYALPARYEPFGLSAVEAALAGCALVLGDIPSLREVWADAALFVPPDDHQSLADTLERVIRSNALREDLSRRAQLRARRYSPERMALGYIEAYKIASGAAARRQAA